MAIVVVSDLSGEPIHAGNLKGRTLTASWKGVHVEFTVVGDLTETDVREIFREGSFAGDASAASRRAMRGEGNR